MSDYISQTITVSSCQSDISNQCRIKTPWGGGGGDWNSRLKDGRPCLCVQRTAHVHRIRPRRTCGAAAAASCTTTLTCVHALCAPRGQSASAPRPVTNSQHMHSQLQQAGPGVSMERKRKHGTSGLHSIQPTHLDRKRHSPTLNNRAHPRSPRNAFGILGSTLGQEPFTYERWMTDNEHGNSPAHDTAKALQMKGMFMNAKTLEGV